MIKNDEIEAYFDKARSFDRDRFVEADRQRRLAWLFVFISFGLSILLTVAIIVLLPLKTVEPFVVRVDNATGVADIVTGLTDVEPVTYNEAITKYFAGLYVRSRENYSAQEASSYYRAAALMSTADEQSRLSLATKATNPESNQAKLGKVGVVVTNLLSISLIDKNVVSVRFDREVRRPGEDSRKTRWVATLVFSFSNASMAAADRLINPLGFLVSNYRIDQETL